jgi:hypothetical protein
MEYSPSREAITYSNCSDLNLFLFPHVPTGSAVTPVAVTATNLSLILRSLRLSIYHTDLFLPIFLILPLSVKYHYFERFP